MFRRLVAVCHAGLVCLVMLSAEVAYAQSPTDGLFVIHQEPYAEVVVSRWSAGDAHTPATERRCLVLFGVNSKGERTAWPQECPTEVEAHAVAAAADWRFKPGEVRQGEVFARFHATFVYPVDGKPYVLLANDIVTRPPLEFPAGLVVRSGFVVTHRPPLRLRGVDLEEVPRGERCTARVEVSAKGRPNRVEVNACPEVLREAVADYVGKWRWAPLQENGQGFRGETTVVVRIP